MPARFELSGDQKALQALSRALKRHADGKELRKELIRELKRPLQPAIAEIKAELMTIGQAAPVKGQASLRRAVARRIRPVVRLSGFHAGVGVRARKTPTARGFSNAPQRLNSARGWRHPVFGDRNRWVVQFGRRDYFDGPLERRRAEFRVAVVDAMERTARKIAAETRS